jgi:Dolichyl-phosphate-mannose-protein mannosyltransferase
MQMKGARLKYILIILIPLVLSAYTHLWNLLGFPSFHIDEAHYLRRAMSVLNGTGPQEAGVDAYPRAYDQPFFGQLFIGGILGLTGYPDSLNPKADLNSIEMLHLVPRIFMGLLAILDTFILFKMVERRYSTKLALVAAIFFAIMPFTWVFRRVYLESVLMPFLLTSVFLALYLKEPKNGESLDSKSKYNISRYVLILLSGIFLGLATYTKIPVITMIPLVGTLVFFNSGKKLRSVGIWLIPVISIPLLWPIYSIVTGQTDQWAYWVLWQAGRDRPLSLSLMNFFSMDPLLVAIGVAGLALTAIKRDFFPLLWISPFLIFSYLIGYVQYFHLALIFPAFCIASAILIGSIQRFIAKYSQVLSYTIIGFVFVFGIVSTTMLITLDVNSDYFRLYTAIAEKIPQGEHEDEKITLIGSHWWVWDSYWIAQYILHKPYAWIDPHLDPNFKDKILTNKVLILADPIFVDSLSRKINSDNLRQIRNLYNETAFIASFTDNVTSQTKAYYPYNTLPMMIWNENHPTGKVILKSNY